MGVHFRFQAAHARCTLVHVLSLCSRILCVFAHKVSSHVKSTTTTPALLVVLVHEERTPVPRLDGSGRRCPRPCLVKIENYRESDRIGRISSNCQRTLPDITTLEFRQFTPFFELVTHPSRLPYSAPLGFANLGDARIKLLFHRLFFSFI